MKQVEKHRFIVDAFQFISKKEFYYYDKKKIKSDFIKFVPVFGYLKSSSYDWKSF